MASFGRIYVIEIDIFELSIEVVISVETSENDETGLEQTSGLLLGHCYIKS